ncbi:MAG: histidine kinase/response regulator hybrid protein [Bacteroidetes bacterium]|nr:MAG: histidine kinase/response regulator hybrid protein [Bacteroidota bacterium]
MNITIKSKLLGGFIVILLLLVSTAVFMVSEFSAGNERLSGIVNVSAERINLSHELQIAVLEVTRNEKNLILEEDPVKKNTYKDRIYQSIEDAENKSARLKELADEKGKLILNEFIVTFRSFKKDIEEIVSLAMKDEDEKAFKISGVQTREKREDMARQLERLVTKNAKSMAADKLLSDNSYDTARNLIIGLIIACILFSIFISYWIIQGITKRISSITAEAEKIASREFTDSKPEDAIVDELRPIFNSLISVNDSFREVTANANSVASGNYATDFTPRSDKDTLGNALKKMTESLRESTAANERHNWLSTGKNQLNEKLAGDQGIEELAANTITFLAGYLDGDIGAVYLFSDKENTFVLSGRYAFASPGDTKEKFTWNEGLIGQAAHESRQILLKDVAEEQLRITSSVLHAKPRNLLITPFSFEGKVLGVIEIGKLEHFTETEKEFVNASVESIAISVNSAIARKRIQELLEETQVQGEELQSQQEELKQMNEELEEQAQNLKQQQEELQMTNEELEEQTQSLEIKNKEVQAAKSDIEQKTKQLEISSRYKSEFLANMSHELRTPLNSLLILSKDLSDNKSKNLDKEQVESAEIIYKSGRDLLTLINEVLDLSKIEAGKMEISVERISVRDFVGELLRDFKFHADQKGLVLGSKFDGDLPEFIRTDSQRLSQILKNLLSNAIKFTEKGSVEIHAGRHTENTLIISVTDTGIGIEEEKQMAIFEAFQQADGGTSRKYGGTGLGLSISRELAKLLGGEIKLASKLHAGSSFSLIIPVEIQAERDPGRTAAVNKPEQNLFAKHAEKNSSFLNYPTIADDRASISKDDKVVLIIEDDLKFAGILLKQANSKGFRCLAAATGEDGLVLVEKYKPQAIILDLDLPGMSGQKVLAELKSNPALRHIPVHIISVNERSLDTIKEGAVEYLMKPVNKKDMDDAFDRIENFVNRQMKNLLIVEDDQNSRKAIRKLIGNGDVQCFEAESGKEALSIYKENHIDCIVLDIGLPDMNGFELIYKLEKLEGRHIPPIIIYTGKELTKEENEELQKYAESIIIKGVRSEERLLDETALFLHRTISNMPEQKRQIITGLYDKETILRAKKILLVDDDMRNVFALSKVLKERGMEIIKAENGRNALEMLEQHHDIDLVLMDIMMPEMDGYEAMRRIRLQEKFKNLPVIALTAKAMKDDKQKCIDAGANDYITKPVDIERLLSLMRVWLSKNM